MYAAGYILQAEAGLFVGGPDAVAIVRYAEHEQVACTDDTDLGFLGRGMFYDIIEQLLQQSVEGDLEIRCEAVFDIAGAKAHLETIERGYLPAIVACGYGQPILLQMLRREIVCH